MFEFESLLLDRNVVRICYCYFSLIETLFEFVRACSLLEILFEFESFLVSKYCVLATSSAICVLIRILFESESLR